ncbi:MAG: hypothetical protein CMF46_05705 [Legionellales bacterium]|nr:hypothetical protein [Legionellales bacterium]|tara:strand:+ start:1030 stop:1341 length:312 start_codon:yes stop_codon:yes gene_type:complete
MDKYTVESILMLVKEKPVGELSGDILVDFMGEGAILLDSKSAVASIVSEPEISMESLGCKVAVSLDDFGLLLSGDLDPVGAYSQGRLQITGDMGLAMELSSWM